MQITNESDIKKMQKILTSKKNNNKIKIGDNDGKKIL